MTRPVARTIRCRHRGVSTSDSASVQPSTRQRLPRPSRSRRFGYARRCDNASIAARTVDSRCRPLSSRLLVGGVTACLRRVSTRGRRSWSDCGLSTDRRTSIGGQSTPAIVPGVAAAGHLGLTYDPRMFRRNLPDLGQWRPHLAGDERVRGGRSFAAAVGTCTERHRGWHAPGRRDHFTPCTPRGLPRPRPLQRVPVEGEGTAVAAFLDGPGALPDHVRGRVPIRPGRS